MEKVQLFKDSKYRNKATLHYVPDAKKPYVLRVRTYFDHLFYISSFDTAKEAKDALEQVRDHNCWDYCEWWTISGYVD